eukprot:RCo034889
MPPPLLPPHTIPPPSPIPRYGNSFRDLYGCLGPGVTWRQLEFCSSAASPTPSPPRHCAAVPQFLISITPLHPYPTPTPAPPFLALYLLSCAQFLFIFEFGSALCRV